jgi:hypothetical protein
MTKEKILKPTHSGKLIIGGNEIPCYVLEDGTRILGQRGTTNALSNPGSPIKSGHWFQRLIKDDAIRPFFSDELLDRFNNPIQFKARGPQAGKGFEANLLVDFCDALLEAKKSGSLKPSNTYYEASIQAEVLIRAFARIGIIALVDEATGYQEVRDRLALQKILEMYVSKDLLPWTKKFPDKFYQEMFRLKGWSYPITKRPSVVGRYTNDLIYKQLPPGVLEELKKQTPKSPSGNNLVRYHQSLTEDIGHPKLHDQILTVMNFMEIAANWNEFMRYFNRKFKGQQTLNLD